MRKSFDSLRAVRGIDMTEYKRISSLVLDRYESYQSHYDIETVFGTSVSTQTIWNDKVNRELRELETWSLE
jgi:hypothetical protein